MSPHLTKGGLGMASDRRQIAVRLDDAVAALWDELHRVSPSKVGVTLTQPQVFALALAALADKWQVTLAPAVEPTAAKGLPAGRGKR